MHAWQMVVLMTSDAEGLGQSIGLASLRRLGLCVATMSQRWNFENQYWSSNELFYSGINWPFSSGGIQFLNIECARALNISRRWNRTSTGAVSKSRKCIRTGWLQLAQTRQFPFLFSMNWPSGKCQMHRQCGAARPNDAQSCRSPPYPQLAESRHDNMRLPISLIFGATVLVTS